MKEIREKFRFLCKKHTDLYYKVQDLTGSAKEIADKGLEHCLNRLRSADSFIESKKSTRTINLVLEGIEKELKIIYWQVSQALNGESETEE